MNPKATATAEVASNRRGRATHQRLLDATDALLAQRGLDVTVEEVAAAAGVARPTVYRHFGDREGLITAAVLRTSGRLAAQLRGILDDGRPFSTRLADAVVLTVEVARSHPSIGAVLTASNPASRWPDVDPEGRFIGAVQDFLRPWLELAVDDGVVLRADVATTLDWLLRQTLLLMLVPSAIGMPAEAIRRDVEVFVVPSLIAHDPHAAEP